MLKAFHRILPKELAYNLFQNQRRGAGSARLLGVTVAARKNVLIRLASGVEEKDLSQEEQLHLKIMRIRPSPDATTNLRFAEESGRAKRDGSRPPVGEWLWSKERRHHNSRATKQNALIRLASGIEEKDLSHEEQFVLKALRISPGPQNKANLRFAEESARAKRDGSSPPNGEWSWIKEMQWKERRHEVSRTGKQSVLVRLASGVEEKALSQEEQSNLEALRVNPSRDMARDLQFAEQSGRAKRDGSTPPKPWAWSWIKRRERHEKKVAHASQNDVLLGPQNSRRVTRKNVLIRLASGVEEKDLSHEEQLLLNALRIHPGRDTASNLRFAEESGRAKRDGATPPNGEWSWIRAARRTTSSTSSVTAQEELEDETDGSTIRPDLDTSMPVDGSNVLIRLASGIEERDLSQEEQLLLELFRQSQWPERIRDLQFAEESGRAKRDGSTTPQPYVWSWIREAQNRERVRIQRRLQAGIEEKYLLPQEQIALETIRGSENYRMIRNLNQSLERGDAERDGSKMTSRRLAWERDKLEIAKAGAEADGVPLQASAPSTRWSLISQAISMLRAGSEEATFHPDLIHALRRYERSPWAERRLLVKDARQEASYKLAAMAAGEPLPLFKTLRPKRNSKIDVMGRRIACAKLRDGTLEEDLCEKDAASIKAIRDSTNKTWNEQLNNSLRCGINIRAGLRPRGKPPERQGVYEKERAITDLIQRVRRGKDPDFTEEEKALLGSVQKDQKLWLDLQSAREMWLQYQARKKLEEAAGNQVLPPEDYEPVYRRYGPSRTIRAWFESAREADKRISALVERLKEGRQE